ncbi:glycosyltransferase [Terriglobus saanensis]|uniref:Glycosyltransferase, MGT family n=1 Tax=Terriglobus saanensis (strain ATCC BAA-1853 / DSM 23119 / SP1PR4) TaxID=401053 RepID=E8V5U5_TERSS|nr:glycosyltransferase [Terriglobus saanensis]ADV82704.1 glycosyltransferase, MGT family [Terriglobus saanensis SP1PR4]
MKIGFVSLPLSGHLHPMTALARKLKFRGHEVVFIGVPDVGPVVRAAGLDFISYCETEYPVGSIAEVYAPISKLHGTEVIRYQGRKLSPPFTAVALESLPEKLLESGVEALVLDAAHLFMELVPMRLGMPYVHIWNVLHLDFSGASPMCFFGWPHETSAQAMQRNVEGLQFVGEAIQPLVEVAMAHAEKVGLQVDWSVPGSTLSRLAIISQTPKGFDFPEIPWPENFYYAGPFHDDQGRASVPFPWEKLTGAPLIYASLGTLVNGLDYLYKTILAAVERIPNIQVVLSVGKNIDLESLGTIPPNTIVVRSAPQIELLKRAELCITHAGLNTALESLAQGVPMVAIPVGYDQPGVAARIAYHGVGEFIEVEDLTVEGLSGLIETVLKKGGYHDRARHFQRVIAETRGLDRAADVIEQVFVKDRAQEALQEDAAQRI